MSEQYFRPRNWDKFQHYKDRRPTWVKVHIDLIDREDFRELPDPTKAHLMLIWVLYARVGRPLPVANRYLARLLGVSSRSLGRSLGVLLSSDFMELCPKTARPETYREETETESKKEVRVTAPPAKPAKEKSNAKRGTRLPEDWSLNAEQSAFATTVGFDPARLAREADRFRDYWLAQPGQKGVKLDWFATWRNWIRRSQEGFGGNGVAKSEHTQESDRAAIASWVGASGQC